MIDLNLDAPHIAAALAMVALAVWAFWLPSRRRR